VNNAGNGGAEGMGLVQFRDSDPSGWMGAINVHLFGVLHCSRAVINGMCERGFGVLVQHVARGDEVACDVVGSGLVECRELPTDLRGQLSGVDVGGDGRTCRAIAFAGRPGL